MATQAALILRVMASSIAVANRAGTIIRDIMSKGDLGIVEKVGRQVTVNSIIFMIIFHSFRE